MLVITTLFLLCLSTTLSTALSKPLAIGLKYHDPTNDSSSINSQYHNNPTRHLSRHNTETSTTTTTKLAYSSSPVFQGIGTHYAAVWVGSPTPQRQTLIIDTGSHYTAFPCKGCNKCGEDYHTDKYYDYTVSSSFKKLGCNECDSGGSCSSGQCMFSQSYTEGSSWHAFQAHDNFFVGLDTNEQGGFNEELKDQFTLPAFMFGCQYAETGLFETQLATGIM